MHEFATARRKNDVIIAVSQDNKAKSIEIVGLNKAAENLLNCKENDLLYKPLTSIFDDSSRNLIKDNLEYDDNGNDLSDLLAKINNLSLMGSDKKVRIRAFRTGNSTIKRINYELLIIDLSLSHKLHMFRDQYLNGKKYNMHPNLEVMDEPSTMLELEVILNFIKKYKTDIVAGIVGFQASDEMLIKNMLKAIVDNLYENCRSEDIIGYLGDDTVIFILIGCSPLYSENVILRLYSKISNITQLSIGYVDIKDESNSAELLSKLKLALHAAQATHNDQSCVRYTQTKASRSQLSED
ncbi:MAG: hypothetical protein sL5_09590 [Candidatus Mesenet longicola]|uniref:GGDEF domain-containing protein n=1 Tax=Candidatus Mesenet longicola TaxID=1892558 RepID=A0A8J3HX99_9RICK|nr:MAG: hypothetical protein sGL2_10180 [Candidatus Mesenet longicola]GHM59966.1 MAG: hypothetical protein sL5_09590 [Candidatus Mesenet longicola]